jgi:hypothetical protein
MQMPMCSSCRYLRSENEFGGFCCRWPPEIKFTKAGDMMTTSQIWPWMKFHDFCGEHAPRDQPLPKLAVTDEDRALAGRP